MEGVALLKIFSRYRGILDLQVLLLLRHRQQTTPGILIRLLRLQRRMSLGLLRLLRWWVRRWRRLWMPVLLQRIFIFWVFLKGLALRLSILPVMHGGMGVLLPLPAG